METMGTILIVLIFGLTISIGLRALCVKLVYGVWPHQSAEANAAFHDIVA